MRMKHMVLSSVVGLAVVTGFISQVSADPIHDAARVGNWDAVKAQLDQGVGVDAQDNSRNTALILAARNGYTTDSVKKLLKHPDINIDLENYTDKTALDIAKETNRTEIVNAIEAYKLEQINNYKTPNE